MTKIIPMRLITATIMKAIVYSPLSASLTTDASLGPTNAAAPNAVNNIP